MKWQGARPKKSPARGTKVPATIRPEVIIVVVAVIAVITLLMIVCHSNTPFWLGKPAITSEGPRPWLPVIYKGEEPIWRAPWLPSVWKGAIPTQTLAEPDNPPGSNPAPVQYRTLEEVLQVEFVPLPHPFTELTITIGGFGPYHPGTLPDWAR